MNINKEFDKLATDSADYLALKMVAIKEFFLKKYGEKSTANILSNLNKMFKSLGEGFEKINDKNFHIIDSMEFILSRENYSRLTIPPGVWFGIKGKQKENIVLNVSDKVHEDDEVKSLNIQHPSFVKIKW